MVFKPWVFRFRVLSASLPNIAYFLFEFKVSFVFEFSVLLINNQPFSRHDVSGVLRLLRIATICDCKRNRGKFKIF